MTTDWRHKSACLDQDPELFFPVGETGPSVIQAEKAKAVCRRCPVLKECLQWALTQGEHDGVWGGLDEHQLRSIRRRAARLAQPVTQVAAATVELNQAKAPTAHEIYAAHTTHGTDSHTVWTGEKTSLRVNGAWRTPMQIGFLVAHGRLPDGTVRARCQVTRCVTPEHLTDWPMRQGLRLAAG